MLNLKKIIYFAFYKKFKTMENFWNYTLCGNTIKVYLISIFAFTIRALILWFF